MLRVRIPNLPRERHQGPKWVSLLLDVLCNRFLPPEGLQAAADDDHRLGVTAQQRLYVGAEVLHHDLDLLGDVVRMEPHPTHQPLHGCAAFHLRVIHLLPVVGQAEGSFVAGVVLQHVEDEALLNRLPHRVHMERFGLVLVTHGLIGLRRSAEQLDSLRLGGRGERNVGDALGCGTACHLGGKDVFCTNLPAVLPFLQLLSAQDGLQLGRCFAGLGRMRFVSDHGVKLTLRRGLLPYLFQGEGERLDRADDDLLLARKRLSQLLALGAAGALDGVDHTRCALEAEDSVLQLLVDHVAVGDHQHGVEDLALLVVVQIGEEVRRPGDGVCLAAACRVLDQELAPGTLLPHRAHQLARGVQLMKAGEDQPLDSLLLVALLDKIAPQNLQPALALPHLLPQVRRAVACGGRRISGCACVALVEG